MTPRAFLVAMTAVAVVGDSLLQPFYPQYLAAVFGLTDPRSVGLYVASCSLTVLLAFPAWAFVSRRLRVLPLLMVTQLLAALFACASFAASSLPWFLVASLAMMVCKASYLLLYPYVMSLEEEAQHATLIGLLAFVVYFGHLLAALAAGVIFQALGARALFLAMAGADLLQLAICYFALRTPTLAKGATRAAPATQKGALPSGFFVKLGVVMLLMYFSGYVTEPFFSAYWEARTQVTNRIASGVVFALPGLAALAALGFDAIVKPRRRGGAAPQLLLLLLGLSLQLCESSLWVMVGRCLYGWALFRTMVELDLIVFRVSTPENYAVDFSRANLFQGLGVMIASFTAGGVVHRIGEAAPFVLAAVGFLAAAVLFLSWLRLPPPIAEEAGGHTYRNPEVLT